MKKTFSILVLLLAVITLSAQDITGKWTGKLTIPQGEVRVIFEISATDDGYTSTFYSPDQVDYGIPVDSTIFRAPELTIKIALADIVWVGTLVDNTTMNGTLTQHGYTLELNMKKADE